MALGCRPKAVATGGCSLNRHALARLLLPSVPGTGALLAFYCLPAYAVGRIKLHLQPLHLKIVVGNSQRLAVTCLGCVLATLLCRCRQGGAALGCLQAFRSGATRQAQDNHHDACNCWRH